ncbi:hypothetical protein MG293_015302 [Ovis ammon polii]|uniref:Uncharacterized protein n=1 Tax=Ovis ammon polii TaxID=230172 RepID=A0AAD4TXI1_OVIAM|nr:hypothetical protein MG293_015302 [Ovis ammon polii]
MKGALLMLALLVTRELTFETHEVEACPVFYEMQIIVNFVLPRAALNETFDSVSATDEEKAAFGKIQDCFIEVGHQNRVNHLIFKDGSGWRDLRDMGQSKGPSESSLEGTEFVEKPLTALKSSCSGKAHWWSPLWLHPLTPAQITKAKSPVTEACPIFYGVFGTVSLGSKTLLNATLDLVAATDEEKAALGKIQDCYNEAGLDGKFLDLLLMSREDLSKDEMKPD